jgi:hypothetical protein
MINTAFLQQSASDVHQKLQMMEGFAVPNTDQLISIEAKVLVNQEEMAKKEKKKYLKKMAKIRTMALKEGHMDRRPGGRPQQEGREKPSVKKNSAPTVRRDIGNMSALTREKRKKKE